MHVLIPFAAPPAAIAPQVLPQLQLPNLLRLVTRLTPQDFDAADEHSFSPPHERALARAVGLDDRDGYIPWAAWTAQKPGAWAWFTLCHWQTHTSGFSLAPLQDLNISAAESQRLLHAVQPYAAEDGIELTEHAPGRWLACGAAFAQLRCAALDRVVGRQVDAWMPQGPRALELLRLQNEMQMLFYTHAVHDERSQRGQRPINSFWLSGAGALTAGADGAGSAPQVQVVQGLRAAALGADWSAWQQAWLELDAGLLGQARQAARQGQALTLTLCGERAAQRWQLLPQTRWQSLQARWRAPTVQTILSTL